VHQAWDGKPLQTMVRHSPLRAREAHSAIIGHITRDELHALPQRHGDRQRLFQPLPPHRRRPQQAPTVRRHPAGRLPHRRLRAAPVRTAVRAHRRANHLRRPRPRTLDRRQPVLSRGEAGLLGAATARAEAHTVRVALLYALLDCSPAVRLVHLDVALADWAYSHASARWVFGDSLGDPTADDIWALAKNRADGVTRTEVRDLFSRNKKAREIDRALTTREEAGQLERHESSADENTPPRSGHPGALPDAVRNHGDRRGPGTAAWGGTRQAMKRTLHRHELYLGSDALKADGVLVD
jgi:hypothetical protein